MSFLDKVTAFLPFGKKAQELEYFFAINIGTDSLTAALWTVEGRQLKILSTASEAYSSNDEIIAVSDKLLDQVLGLKEIEPQKILFGVPASWLSDDSLKDEYLKILRSFVKELELTPMAYVSTSNALIHFLEKQDGIPTTAILVGFQKLHLTVTIVRAGKLDGVKVIKRGESSGTDIEKALLTFTDIETLPSKILIYGPSAGPDSIGTGGLKSQLSSFAWMSKLSFLHLPKIDELGQDLEIKSICLAGGSEINGNISYSDHEVEKHIEKVAIEETEVEKDTPKEQVLETEDNFGFVVGDVEKDEVSEDEVIPEESNIASFQQPPLEIDDFERDLGQPVANEKKLKPKFSFRKLIPIVVFGVVVLFAIAYFLLVKADIKIFVEPKIIEKDAQVVADPGQKTVDENNKIIPGQMVEIEVSGSAKDTASGKRQIGDPAKGTVVIINNTAQGQNFSAGTTLISSGGIKFKLDNTASVSATLSDSASKSTVTAQATAVAIGADGNIPSETKLTIGKFTADQFVGKTQGNFSGGTSKDVTVVSSEDQQKLLAKLSSDLRQQAQQKLQDKYPNKKILEEALLESITRKSYSKNINDQASEFSLNLAVDYKGTAFDDTDLRTIVSKLVNLQVPDGFTLDLSATETQADISKLEKDGKLIFLAKFKAKFIPKIDTDKIKNQIKFKTPDQVTDILKGMDNILSSEISLTPNLPKPLSRLPLLIKNIKIEVGLK
ncbi:baseplate J/gp47 family protein [Candidatus Daviesbacteria bacterium]|nr:baseplate J/gp47 family protein [Candidatus Daviesbacteria bacterium]